MNRDLINKVLFCGASSPSAHNTQPWFFRVSERSIFLEKETNRMLRYSDPNEWESILSLGACLENLVEASKACDIFSTLKIFPKGDKDKVVAEIMLKPATKVPDELILNTILMRQTNRSNYKKDPVPEKIVDRWKAMAQENQVNLMVVTEKSEIKEIGNLHKEATKIAFSDPKFRLELSGWIRNSLTKKNDGMPGYSTNIPFPMSFAGQWLIKNFNIGEMQGSIEKSALLSSPLLLVFLSNDLSKKNILKVGSAFEKVAIDITKEGLVCAPLGAIIEVPNVSTKLRRILNVEETPLMIIRVGYSNKIYKKAPKRSLEEVIR